MSIANKKISYNCINATRMYFTYASFSFFCQNPKLFVTYSQYILICPVFVPISVKSDCSSLFYFLHLYSLSVFACRISLLFLCHSWLWPYDHLCILQASPSVSEHPSSFLHNISFFLSPLPGIFSLSSPLLSLTSLHQNFSELINTTLLQP